MPLPDHPLTLHGGCNCGAIRYKIEVPAQSERPLNPLSDGKVTFPVVLTDHCNDCRKATASILPTWICVPKTMMYCQLTPIHASSEPTNKTATENKTSDESWIPAITRFHENPDSEKYWLKFYQSSERATRSFCGKCGTNLTYSISPSMGDGWPDLFDVLLGTIDKADVEKDWMAPDRHCWVECEIGWIRELTNGRPGMPRHPTYKLNEFAG